MRTTQTSIARAVAATLLGLAAASMAHAGLVIATPGVAFDYSTSISDSEGGAATTSQSNVALGSSQLSQFDPTLGVLTGATLTLNSTRTQTTTTASTDGPDNGNDNTRITSGSGSSTAALSVGGQNLNFASVSQADSCTGGRLQACNDGASSSSAATNASLGLAAAERPRRHRQRRRAGQPAAAERQPAGGAVHWRPNRLTTKCNGPARWP